jgi:predicted metal-dependent hydrolase
MNFIIQFLEERREWTKAQYERNKSQNPKKPNFDEGEIIPLFGAERKIIHTTTEESAIKPNKFILNIKGLRSDNGRIIKAKKFIKEELERRSFPIATEYTHKTRTKKYSLKIKTMKSLWGSCSPHNLITLNLALAFCPDFVLKYVIIHEVSHTIEHNHSNRFWRLLESMDPDYKKAEKWIKENGKKILCYLF